MFDQLLDKVVKVTPNDFIDREIKGEIIAVDKKGRSILVKFDEPIENYRTKYLYAVASLRLSADSLDSLLRKGQLGFSITWVPNDEFDSANLFDLSWWRGSAAAIADLIITENQTPERGY